MKHITRWLVKAQAAWGLFLIFSIPISLRYLTKEPFAISWLNVFSVIFIGLTVLNIVTGRLKLVVPKQGPFLLMCGALFIAMAWALLFTDPLRNGIGLWTSRLTQPFLVGYGVYLLVRNGYVRVEHCVAALFWSLVPLLILGVFQLTGFIAYTDPGRVTASYFYPNTFARYLHILLLVSLPWIVFGVHKGKRLLLGMWLLGILLLLSTKSYNGSLSLYAGIVAFFWGLPQTFSTWKRVALTGLLIIALVVAVNAPKLPKWQTSIRDSRLTRLEYWGVATKVIGDHFWTGIGIKTWEVTYPKLVEKYGPFPPLNWGSVQPHNVFLDAFVKAGLPGFFAISTLLFWPILEGRAYSRTYRKKNPVWWYGMSILGYGVAMVVFGLIDDPLWSDDTVPIFFILTFLLVSLQEKTALKVRN